MSSGRMAHRYKQLHSKVRSESTHTLTLDNGVALRKSGVATKFKPKKSKAASKCVLPVPPRELKKRAAHPVLPPPTPREVKERFADLRTVVLNRKTVKTCRLFR